MTPDQNKAIALIIPLIVKNNAGKVALALREAGYSKDFIPTPDLEARLFQLYTANPDLFFSIMKTIPWNPGHKETNEPELKEQLLAVVSEVTGKEISKDTWWPELLDYLSPALQEEDNSDIISDSGSGKRGLSLAVGFLFVLAIIGIIICLFLLFT